MVLKLLYQNYIFDILYVILFFLIILFFLNIRAISKHFRNIKRKYWLILLIIFAGGAIIRLLIFPHFHIMFIDEPLYSEIANNLNLRGMPVSCEHMNFIEESCYLPNKPPAWPFLISIIYRTFGINNYYPIYFNSMLGYLSIILIFLLGYAITKNSKAGLWSALMLSIFPMHIIWSNTAGTNNPSLFFILLTCIFYFIYLEQKGRLLILLTIFSLIIASLIRFENILLIPLFIFFYIIRKHDKIGEIFQNFQVLIFAIIISVFIFTESYFIQFFRGDYLFFDNFFLSFFSFLKAASFGYVLLIIPLIGFIINRSININKIKELAYLFIAFFIFYVPLFSEDRMALIPAIFLIMINSIIIEDFIRKNFKRSTYSRYLILIIILFFFGNSLMVSHKSIERKYSPRLLETAAILKIPPLIPASGYLILEYPTEIHAVSNIKSMRTGNFLTMLHNSDEFFKNNEVYYFYNGYCIKNSLDPAFTPRDKCQEMLKKFDMEIVKEFRRNNVRYYLYKILNHKS